MKKLLPSLLLCTLAALGGCSDSDAEPITLSFTGVVGAEDFVCGESYDGLGSSNTSLTLTDFRLYVSNLRLVDRDGNETPLLLEQDGKWQHEGVALLDFENGCGDMGNADLNSTVRGTAPPGDYVGVRFHLGVPFAHNHANSATAPAPLNLSSMFWNWQGGYKFLRVDSAGMVMASGWRFHLGSTDCQGDAMNGGVTSCNNANRPSVELRSFEHASDTIAVDLEMLMNQADLEQSDMGLPDGCMSGGADAACAPYFANLGIDFGGATAPAQTFFRVQ